MYFGLNSKSLWASKGHFQKTYIWSNEDLQGGKTHLWHKKFSYPNTKWFGQFACRVTSKILGIGSAEQNWGEVKHLKTNKCSHLSSDHIKKQATIFGADCAACAKLEREWMKKGEGNSGDDSEYFFWDDEDFDIAISMDPMVNGDKKQKSKCVVKCWVEDWEHTALLPQDILCLEILSQIILEWWTWTHTSNKSSVITTIKRWTAVCHWTTHHGMMNRMHRGVCSSCVLAIHNRLDPPTESSNMAPSRVKFKAFWCNLTGRHVQVAAVSGTSSAIILVRWKYRAQQHFRSTTTCHGVFPRINNQPRE